MDFLKPIEEFISTLAFTDQHAIEPVIDKNGIPDTEHVNIVVRTKCNELNYHEFKAKFRELLNNFNSQITKSKELHQLAILKINDLVSSLFDVDQEYVGNINTPTPIHDGELRYLHYDIITKTKSIPELTPVIHTTPRSKYYTFIFNTLNSQIDRLKVNIELLELEPTILTTVAPKIIWNKSGAHLSYFIRKIFEKGYIELPHSTNEKKDKEIIYAEAAPLVYNSFDLKKVCTEETIERALSSKSISPSEQSKSNTDALIREINLYFNYLNNS